MKLLALASFAVLGTAGYYLYSVRAQATPPDLAQAPLHVSKTIPTAFIMALDDSGSMVWEMLNNTRDGVYVWNGTSFYNGSEAWGYDSAPAGDARFYYNFPVAGHSDDSVMPPIDAFGFARSPDVNTAYFDPRITYSAWKNGDGTNYLASIDPAAAPVDPRPTGSEGKTTATLDLTSVVAYTGNDNNRRFRVRAGMVLPVGAEVRGNCNSTPALPAYTGDWRILTQVTTINQSCRLSFKYYPATFYLADPDTLPASYGYTATPVAVTDPAGGRPGTLYRYEIKLANFNNDTAAYGAAMQNFASWFSYYRSRREGLIGSVTNALGDVSKMRVGWFRISNRVDVTMRDMSDTTERNALFSEIHRMRASGSTPNRRAVRHIGEQFKRSTGTNLPVVSACQKNAGMLFTDGYINEEGNSPDVGGNLDGTRMPTAPFSDTVDNTMADIVVPYYLDSLRPDIDTNEVPVPGGCSATTPDPKLDCQTNLHMNFYGITLGTRGRLFDVSYLADANDPAKVTPDPYANPPTWHTAREDLNPNAVDEMWHATLNARGMMVNARSPAAVTEAMRRILASVGDGSSPSGTLSLTGSRIGTGSLVVEPSYTALADGDTPPLDWYGELRASTAIANPLTGHVTTTQAWEAGNELPAHGARNIRFGMTSSSVVPTVAAFSDTNLTAAGVDLAGLCAGELAPGACATYIGSLGVNLGQAVNYLRGDQSLEGTRFRTRTKVLGDIVNSTPVVTAGRVITSTPTVVRTVDDYGYRALGGTYATTYAAYLATKRSSGKQMVYVGANDGMLHAFDGETGEETFAYIPATAVGHLGNLLFPYDAARGANQNFQHRYYVDGPVTISDVFDGTSWKTVLVGTSGAGGRSVFALDVTDPDDISVLWEVNDLITGHTTISENIGYVLGKPVIVPIKGVDGSGNPVVSWKVVFGNGYNSASQTASLFVVDAITGATSVVTAAEDPDGNDLLGYNGMGNVVVVDMQRRTYANDAWTAGRDGFADTVYASDQNGAVWKFNLVSSTTGLTEPFYVARDASTQRQPITGGLDVAAGPGTASMVFFGTGSYSFENDSGSSGVQTFYAIMDRPVTGYSVSGRGDLLAQSVGSDTGDFRATSTNAITGAHKGWYIDLPAGERMIGYPRVESGVIFFPTYAPPAGSSSLCGLGGDNYLYGLNALSGAAALTRVRMGSPDGTQPASSTGAIKLDAGDAPVKDVAVMTTPRVSPLSGAATDDDVDDALGARCSMVINVAGAPLMYLPRPCGRQSWRQVR
ncbi:pilus assembly protein [Pseudoxanthomonas jiangsuensis]|uniref:pilus assembly protein n=1 Tax=Pseudoxanthomonas jiangsuensis TaxID=619688 RepID=UPI001FEAE54D|nr:PilC/PilY family type IV pilus protein [Pseudoxanthomonas jiangsuensis]